MNDKHKLRADFGVVFNNDKLICLIDNCNETTTMSITNDAENVVLFVHKAYGLKGKTLYYIDTQGCVDILTHDDNGKFMGFKKGYDTFLDFKRNEVIYD